MVELVFEPSSVSSTTKTKQRKKNVMYRVARKILKKKCMYRYYINKDSHSHG